MVNDDLQQQQPNEPHLQEPPLAEALEEQDPALAAPEEASEGEPPLQAGVTVARLVVKRSGVETDTEFPINPPAVIGRFDPSVGPVDVDLGGLPEGSYVSRKHAKITYEDGAWKIHDLGSSNGTFVLRDDFERVDESELGDGQEFALGNARFVFHYS
jgi:pSer/pThr/pTyr-binding forkhead associated (FHA) protein